MLLGLTSRVMGLPVKDFSFSLMSSVCLCVHMSVGAHRGQVRVSHLLALEFTGVCEPPAVDAGTESCQSTKQP